MDFEFFFPVDFFIILIFCVVAILTGVFETKNKRASYRATTTGVQMWIKRI